MCLDKYPWFFVCCWLLISLWAKGDSLTWCVCGTPGEKQSGTEIGAICKNDYPANALWRFIKIEVILPSLKKMLLLFSLSTLFVSHIWRDWGYLKQETRHLSITVFVIISFNTLEAVVLYFIYTYIYIYIYINMLIYVNTVICYGANFGCIPSLWGHFGWSSWIILVFEG